MATEVTVPQLGESIVEATVGRWLKQVGEAVEAGEPLLELETDKVNLEVPAPEAGVVEAIVKGEGETVGVGEVLGTVGSKAASSPPAAQPLAKPVETVAADATVTAQAPPVAASAPESVQRQGVASPSVRKLAVERTVDLRSVAGSGPRGRITREDVVAAAPAAAPVTAPAKEAAATIAPVAAVSPAPVARPAAPRPIVAGEREERIHMSRRRLTIARQLVSVHQTAAMLTTFNEVDLTAIQAVRHERKEAFKQRHGVSLGLMSFFTKAVLSALKAFPRLNAEVQGDEMVIKHHYDIGIAVSTPEGLVVPVVRDADRLSFSQIESEIAAVAEKARTGALTLEDLRGGTFTITNGGVFGSLLSTPILNPPQVGILGMHGIQQRPMAINGQVEIRPMMYLALSYDHRIVDGSESVRFLVHVKKALEDPIDLLLEG